MGTPYELGKNPSVCLLVWQHFLTSLTGAMWNCKKWIIYKCVMMKCQAFQSCDSLMSQLPLRAFHLKHIFRTAVSVNVHFKVRMRQEKCFAFNAFCILFWFSPHFEKAFCCPLPSPNGCQSGFRFCWWEQSSLKNGCIFMDTRGLCQSRGFHFSDFSSKLDQTSGTTFRYQPICWRWDVSEE